MNEQAIDVIDLRAFRQIGHEWGKSLAENLSRSIDINIERALASYRELAARTLRDHGRAGLAELERTLLPNVARLYALAPLPPIRVQAADALLLGAIEWC